MFYVATCSFLIDEFIKFYHVGLNYFGFWNILNDSMYSIILASMIVKYRDFDVGFRILCLAAPLMWLRLLLFLDTDQFIGAMIVVVKVMMKESLIFFTLLIIVIVGFSQGFLGLDNSDGKRDTTLMIMENLIKVILGDGDFKVFNKFVPPYAGILYYCYGFLVTVILLNILIALYSSSYQKIYDNSLDEYMALIAEKTFRYVRAPDIDVFIPPLNIIELMITPVYYINRPFHAKLCHFTMNIIYSPFLIIISFYEANEAKKIQFNRLKGLKDDANEYDREWDLSDGFIDEITRNQEYLLQFQQEYLIDPEFNVDDDWFKKVDMLKPNFDKSDNLKINWDLYPIYKKLQELNSKIEKLENK